MGHGRLVEKVDLSKISKGRANRDVKRWSRVRRRTEHPGTRNLLGKASGQGAGEGEEEGEASRGHCTAGSWQSGEPV